MIERTLVLVKPDGVQRGLIGEVLKRFEQRGLKVVGMKMVRPDVEMTKRHYTEDMEWMVSTGTNTKKSYEKKGIKDERTPEEIGRWVRGLLMGYLSSGPVVAVVLEGYHAVSIVRKLVGPTEPSAAAPGTIRGDYSTESYEMSDKHKRPVKNIVHASDSAKTAAQEIKVWFAESELYDYERVDWKAIH